MTRQQILDAIDELSRAGANVDVNSMHAVILARIARSDLNTSDRSELETELNRKRDELTRRQPPLRLEDMTPEQLAEAQQLMGNRPQNEQEARNKSGFEPTEESPYPGETFDYEAYQGVPMLGSTSVPNNLFLTADEQRAVFEQQTYSSDGAVSGGGAVSGAVSGGGGGGGGGGGLPAVNGRDANMAEVEQLLAEQFGGFAFFLQKHRSDLQVGLTADGQVVASDDPNAETVKNILDVIVDQGITAPTRVAGIIKNTEWWKKTDARMREYDVVTADMSGPQKTEYLEPVLDMLREEAQFLGIQLDSTIARNLAEDITRMGEENDVEYIRGVLTAEAEFNAAESVSSGFAAQRDRIVAMSKQYFTPIGQEDAASFAEDIYLGTKTEAEVEQYFKEMAGAKYPPLQNSLNANITPEQYFAPYKYEIERMLDRPNVDLYEEFGDVVEFIPDTGTGEARPMTLGEVRKYVRGLDEWQQSSQGTDSARALSFSIGKLFGEVA